MGKKGRLDEIKQGLSGNKQNKTLLLCSEQLMRYQII
jgi:hypothetical protein